MPALLLGAWGLLRSPLGRALGVGLIAIAALGYAYMKGAESEAGKCDAAALRARIETLERDLEAARRAEALARQQKVAAENREKTLTERLTTYESGLGATPPACLLSPADADSLRKLTR